MSYAATRRDDYLLLRRIRLRSSGLKLQEISELENVGYANIARATNAVRDADLRESGEDVDAVAGCYW